MPLLDLGAIQGRAMLVRAKAGLLDVGPPYSTHKLCEAAFPDLPVSGAELPRGVMELAEHRAGGARALWYARGAPQPAQRVAICHGLHHFYSDLRDQPGMRECNTGLRELRRAGAVEPSAIEVACDVFAGELLVPFPLLDQQAPAELFPKTPAAKQHFDDEVDRLASMFNVPAGFIRWRLWDLLHLRRTNFYVGA